MFAGLGSASIASYIDPTQPRKWPDRPTNVDLPDYSALNNHHLSDWATQSSRPQFRSRYGQLKRTSDLNGQFLHDFNIRVTPPISIKELIPIDTQGHTFLPNTDPQDQSPLAEVTRENQKIFLLRIAELKHDNDILYRTVCRVKLPDGVDRIRLACFRNFFSALEGMSEHWETDLDDYFISGQEMDDDFPISGHEINFDAPFSSPARTVEPSNESPLLSSAIAATGLSDKMTEASHDALATATTNGDTEAMAIDSAPSDSTITTPQTPPPPVPQSQPQRLIGRSPSISSTASSSSSEADIPVPMYRGRRISNGIKMPWLYRTETVKGFFEAAIFPFNYKLSVPRAPATLLVAGVRIPVRQQTFLVHRMSRDLASAKQGIVEGPVMGSFVRQDVEAFSAGTAQQRKEKLELDVLREVGSLLHLAQERRREGKEERVWTKKTVPAGRHWFSEMASDGGKPDESPPEDNGGPATTAAAIAAAAAALNGKDKERKRKKVKTKYEMWREMQPQRPQWDPKIKYVAVGKEEGSEWDEVYMLSSMYHHVSIVKLRVHSAYIDYITDGTLREPVPADPQWCQPVLQRSQWFDLFDIRQRVEAFRCLWGVMCYSAR